MARTPLFQQFIRILQQARREHLKSQGKPLPIPKGAAYWSRRRFIRSATLAAGAAMATSKFSRAQQAGNRQNAPRIAIIGGGIAGLNAGYQLKKAGRTATVYEAKDRLGGRIFSTSRAVDRGLVTDLGGHFINTEHEDMFALVEEFSLELFNRPEHSAQLPAPQVAYYFEGQRRSETEVADKLRSLAVQIMGDADSLDADFEQFAPVFDQMSVTEYLDRHSDKITEPFIRTLIENSIRTEYGVEPDQSSALQLLFNLPTVDGDRVEILGASDEAFVVQGGSGKIIQSLAEALSGQIQTRMRLTGIESQGSGYRLSFANNQHVDADYVIIAIPFTVLRHVDIRVDLPPTLRRFINEVNLGLNEKFFVGFKEKPWRKEQGFAQDAWTDLGFSSLWEATQRQTERTDGALTFFFGGDEVKNIQTGQIGQQGQKLLNQFENMIPDAKQAASGQFFRTRWSQDPLVQGGYTNFKPGQLMEFADFLYIEADTPDERQDVNVGNLVFAGEHLSDEFYGYMNGAAQTGRLAAETILLGVVPQEMTK